MFIKCRNNNGFTYVAFFNLSALLRFNLRKINIHHQSQKKAQYCMVPIIRVHGIIKFTDVENRMVITRV